MFVGFSTVLGSSPWIVHFWKTTTAFDQGSYLGTPKNYTANKDERNKPCHGCPIPWGSRVGTAWGHLCSQQSSIRLLPSREQTSFMASAPPIPATKHFLVQNIFTCPLPQAAPHRTVPDPQAFPEAGLCSPEWCPMPDLLSSKRIFKSMVKRNHHPNPYHLFPHF